MIVVVVLAMCLGIVTAVVASEKGRNPLVWWLFGTALFIVALPCALLIRPSQSARDARALSDGGVRCPHCAEIVRRQATVCRFCGRDLPPPPPAALPPSQLDDFGQI